MTVQDAFLQVLRIIATMVGCWPLSIPTKVQWPLLLFGVGPFSIFDEP